MLDSPEDHDIGVLACMVNCSYKATCLSKTKVLERCLLRSSRKQGKSLSSKYMLDVHTVLGRENNGSGPQWVKN